MRKALLLFAVLGLAGSLWAADPFVGTWKMNPAKSKTSGYPIDKSFITKIEGQHNGIKSIEEVVEANGNVIQRRWAAKYDGKDYPIEGEPHMDTVFLKRTNTNTINYVIKKNGKQYLSGEWAVSKDGKSSTDAGSGKDEKGQAFTYTIFLEKQ